MATCAAGYDGMNEDDRPHITETKARAGVTPHMTRYVLGFGLLLVILAYLIIYLASS